MAAMTLEEMEKGLSKIQAELSITPPCRNPGCPCASTDYGTYKGRPRFWYGSDCTLPAKKFCDPCLAYWHVAVARNILLNEIKHAR